MAASLNRVFLMGNLTRDPELRYVPSGQAVTSFTVAVNRAYLSQTGEKKEEVSFIRVVVWGRKAETSNEYLKKGSPVFIEGRLQSRSWDAPDGTKRSTLEVVAQNVQFLPRGTGGRSQDAPDAAGDLDASMMDESPSLPSKGSAPLAGHDLQPEEEIPF